MLIMTAFHPYPSGSFEDGMNSSVCNTENRASEMYLVIVTNNCYYLPKEWALELSYLSISYSN